MRISAAGQLSPIDNRFITDLVAAFHGEWRQLRFAHDGPAIHPDTGEPEHDLRLVNGQLA